MTHDVQTSEPTLVEALEELERLDERLNAAEIRESTARHELERARRERTEQRALVEHLLERELARVRGVPGAP